MSIIKNINLTLKLGFTKISINKNFSLVLYGSWDICNLNICFGKSDQIWRTNIKIVSYLNKIVSDWHLER